MVFLALTRAGYEEIASLLDIGANVALWVSKNVLRDNELATLRATGASVTNFTREIDVADGAAVDEAIEIVQEHHPHERVWVEGWAGVIGLKDLRDHWAKTEAVLRGVLAGAPALTDEDRSSILEYLDHNELGLALETLCSAIKIGAVTITPSQYEAIARVQAEMNMCGLAETVSHLVRQ